MFQKKEFEPDFYVLRDINWTGTVIMAPFGEVFGAEAVELCEGFGSGSIYFLLDRGGNITARGADHGDCDFPEPAPDERLCLISTSPMLMGANLLETMARIYPMTDPGPSFQERDRSDASHFLIKLREAGVGLPEAELAQTPDLN